MDHYDALEFPDGPDRATDVPGRGSEGDSSLNVAHLGQTNTSHT